MIKQGHARAKLSQQIQAVESATENAKRALIHDHISLGVERPVKSTCHIRVREADREREVLDVAISSEEEDSRVFMLFAKDLGFDLDAIHFLYQPAYRDRTMTVSETKPIPGLAENGSSQGASRNRFSPLRLGAASRLILVAVSAGGNSQDGLGSPCFRPTRDFSIDPVAASRRTGAPQRDSEIFE
jgi:DNA-binding FrmR family transcriptional regulator